MFQSNHEHSEYHAISRAISGGPVYVCDYPGEQNKDVISKLMLEGGRVPKFDRPAIPTADTLMTDVLSGEGLAKITNVKDCDDVMIGQIGLFNCDISDEKTTVKGVLRVSDIPEFNKKYSVSDAGEMRFAVYDVIKDVVCEMALNDEMKVELTGLEAATFVVSPIVNDIAVLGVKGKYAMSACVEKVKYTGDQKQLEVVLDEAVPADAEVITYKK